MTSVNKLATAIGMIISLLSLSGYAQSSGPDLNQFSTHGISFEYLAGYSVTDESTAEAQRFILTRKGSSVHLTIVAMRRMVLPNEMPVAIENFKEPIIKEVGITLGLTTLRDLPLSSPSSAQGRQKVFDFNPYVTGRLPAKSSGCGGIRA